MPLKDVFSRPQHKRRIVRRKRERVNVHVLLVSHLPSSLRIHVVWLCCCCFSFSSFIDLSFASTSLLPPKTRIHWGHTHTRPMRCNIYGAINLFFWSYLNGWRTRLPRRPLWIGHQCSLTIDESLNNEFHWHLPTIFSKKRKENHNELHFHQRRTNSIPFRMRQMKKKKTINQFLPLEKTNRNVLKRQIAHYRIDDRKMLDSLRIEHKISSSNSAQYSFFICSVLSSFQWDDLEFFKTEWQMRKRGELESMRIFFECARFWLYNE